MSAFLHIMVNYRNDRETEAFLKKCLQLKGADHGTFVIANNSASSTNDTSFSIEHLSHEKQVRVMNCPDNPGYFPAAQRAINGIDLAQFKFIILSNTDLEIQNDQFYQILLKRPENSEIGVIAPSVRSELTKREGNPLYWTRPTKRKIHFLKFIYSNYLFAWIYHVLSFLKSRMINDKEIMSDQTAYAPHGCFLVLTKNYFQAGGDFTHGVRLYGEEVALAEKLRTLKLKVMLDFSLKVFHREKGTEVSLWNRVTLSKRTFHFKQEAAEYLDQIFAQDNA